MKRGIKWWLLLLVILSCLISSPIIQKIESSEKADLCNKLKPCELLTQADAERILGQSVRLIGERSESRGEVRQCICMYTGIVKDPVSGQDINLYFSFEQKESSPSAEQAQQVMASTKSENAHDAIIKSLSAIGDEAFRLGEESNIHFIMARKGGVIIRLQIKQATEKTSFEELKSFASKVAKRL